MIPLTGPAHKVKIPALDKFQAASEGLKDGPVHHTHLLEAAELSDSDRVVSWVQLSHL